MVTNQPIDDVSRVIVLVRGMTVQNGFYWCYVAVKPSRYEEFKKATSNKYNIQNFVKDEYGEVIVSGEGREPAKAVTEKVAELFGLKAESFFTDEDPVGTINKALLQAQS